MSERNDQIVAMVEQLTVSELAQLIKTIKERFGVGEFPLPVPRPVPVQEEQPTPEVYDVLIEEIGPGKVALIRAVRALLDVKLMEAKKIVDSVPVTVLEGVSAAEAGGAVDTLREAGAVAILTPVF